jgi:hypothetical protein
MKKNLKTLKHRTGQSVPKELKQGFETWVRGLREISQGPQNPTATERKNEPPPGQSHRETPGR